MQNLSDDCKLLRSVCVDCQLLLQCHPRRGQSGKAMMGQLLGNLLNVILDPIMILVFGWNIAGAAIATVIGNVVGAGYYIVYFLKGSSSLSISLKDFSVKEKVASGVLVIGVPAALGNLLMSLSSIIMNSQMAK